MPIDASIPLQVQQFQAPDIMGDMGKAYQLKNLQLEGQMNQYKLEDVLKQRQVKERLSGILKGADLSSPEGQAQFVQQAMELDPDIGMAYGEQFAKINKEKTATQKSHLELKQMRNDYAGARSGAFLEAYKQRKAEGASEQQIAMELQPQYESVISEMRGMVYPDGTPVFSREELQGIPPQFDINWLNQSFMGAMQMKEQIQYQMSREKVAETVRHNQATEGESQRYHNAQLGQGQQRINIAQQNSNAYRANLGGGSGSGWRPMTKEEAAGFGISDPAGYVVSPKGEPKRIAGSPKAVAAKPPSDSARLASGYAARMRAAEERMIQSEEAGANPGSLQNKILRDKVPLGNYGIPAQDQKLRQAQEDWVRAKLRKESGATIPPNEMEDEIRTYFPQPGDKPENIEAKEQARAVAFDAIVNTAGGAYTGDKTPPKRKPKQEGTTWTEKVPGHGPRKNDIEYRMHNGVQQYKHNGEWYDDPAGDGWSIEPVE